MALLTALKNNPNVRRIFGKRELAIIRKQLLGVKLKPSERTRLSRDVRKKFEAIKTLSAFENEFNVKSGAEIKHVIRETLEILKESKWFPRIKRVILFGSAVDGTLTLNSDIDFAVEFSEIAKNEATLFRTEVMGKASDKADVQVENVLPEKLKKEINLKGRIIYEKNSQQDQRT